MMREYWAAWGEVLGLTREVAGELAQYAQPLLQQFAGILLLIGWIIGEALLINAGDYWEAVGAFVGGVVLALLIAGHLAACAIMREESGDD